MKLRKPVEVGAVESVHLGLRLPEGRARLEPADALPVVGVANLALRRSKRRRNPEAEIGVDEVEASRHHAYNGKRLPTHAGGLGQAPLPGFRKAPGSSRRSE